MKTTAGESITCMICYIFALFKVGGGYSSSFNLSDEGEISWIWTVRDRIPDKKYKENS